MAHDTAPQIFVGPVKDAIRSTLIALSPDLKLDNVTLNDIERNPTIGAKILLSRQIMPGSNRKDERTAGGRNGIQWRVGEDVWARHLRASLSVFFDIEIWASSLDASTRLLFGFVATLPRTCGDGHSIPGGAIPDGFSETITGNPVELTVLNPLFPDDTTSVAKSYRSRCIVRADGAIYHDALVLRRVSTVVRPGNPPFIGP